MSTPKLHSIIGYRTDLRNGLHVIDEETVIYPAGNVYVLHNTNDNTQRFLTDKHLNNATQANFDPESKTLALTVPGKRRDFVALFDLNTTERSGSLSCDRRVSKTFVCLTFSPDGTHVIGQTGSPDWKMIFWDWVKSEVICAYEPLHVKKEAEVYQISFHPKDPNQVCSVGKKFLRTYRVSGGNFKQYIYQKHEEADILYLCPVWFSKTKIAIGTSEGSILIMENNEQVNCIKVSDEYSQDPNKEGMLRRKEVDRILVQEKPISYLIVINKLLLALWDHQIVVVFEITANGIKKVPIGIIELPPEEIPNSEHSIQKILSVVVSPKGRFVAVSTSRQQIYSFSLSDADWEYCFRQTFVHFLYPTHWSSIEDLDVCVQKPLLVVSTPDFLHIWNYKTQNLELRKRIFQGLSSVAFHPSGNYVLAGCLDKLRYYAVYLNDMKVLKEYPIRASNKCAFSAGGHRFAATTGYVINIYSSISFELVTRLRGHFGEVTSVLWSENENYLVSCGMDGAVYKWNIMTSEREQDLVIPTCACNDMAMIENGKIVLVVASDLTIKKIKKSHVVFDTECDVTMTSCVSSYSEKRLFLGTAEGNLRVEQLPLGPQLKGETQVGHLGPVKKLKLSYDGWYLMTAGEDSTLCFWKVKPDMTRKQPIIKSTFIVEDEINEKIQKIKEQEKYIENLQVSKNYQIKEKEIFHAKHIDDLINGHKNEIESLTKRIDELNGELMKIEERHHKEIFEKSEAYTTILQKQKEEYVEKLIVEYRRLEKAETRAKKQHDEQKEELEMKIKEHQRELEAVRTEYENKLSACNKELQEIKNRLKNKESVWEEYIEEMEVDVDEEILDLRKSYEGQLRKKKETVLILKTELSILRTKILSQKSEIEHSRTRIKETEQTVAELQEIIQNLNNQLQIFRAEISTRDKNLAIREKRSSELQARVDHLEKYNFVLKEDLNIAKQKLEPREAEKKLLEEKIEKLKAKISESNAEADSIKFKMKKLESKLCISEKEKKMEKQKASSLKLMLTRCQQDIQECKHKITDPKLLVESVNLLYKKHVDGRQVQLKTEDDKKLCFQHERKHLEDIIVSIQEKLQTKEKLHQKLLAEAKKENAVLLMEIHRLQNTTNQVKKDI